MDQQAATLLQPHRFPVSQYVLVYLLSGWAPFPIDVGDEEPPSGVRDWFDGLLTSDNIEFPFKEPINIGILTGKPSNGLIDVVLDDPDAFRFAKRFLPKTEAIFGRASKPARHWLYRVNRPKATVQFQHDGEMIIELRGNGSCSVVPESIHESGELIEFVPDSNKRASRKPADIFVPVPDRVRMRDLEAAVVKVAIATVLFKHWQPDIRHQLVVAVPAFLTTRAWSEEEVIDLIGAVSKEAGDQDVEGRLAAVRTSFERVLTGSPSSQVSQLEEILGRETFDIW